MNLWTQPALHQRLVVDWREEGFLSTHCYTHPSSGAKTGQMVVKWFPLAQSGS